MKNLIKYKVAKNVTSKVVGDGALSTVAAVRMVKNSNERNKKSRMGNK